MAGGVMSAHFRIAASGALAVALLALLPAPGPVHAPPPGPRPAAALAAQGRELAGRYQCGACHHIPQVLAAQGRLGPSLARFARRSYIAGHAPNDDATLQRWLVAPAAVVPGTTMPALGVTPEHAQAIAAFLGTLE